MKKKLSILFITIILILIGTRIFATTEYTVQIGVFEQLEMLENFKNTLESKGIEFRTVNINNRVYIYSGDFETYGEAKLAYDEITKKGIDGYIKPLEDIVGKEIDKNSKLKIDEEDKSDKKDKLEIENEETNLNEDSKEIKSEEVVKDIVDMFLKLEADNNKLEEQKNNGLDEKLEIEKSNEEITTENKSEKMNNEKSEETIKESEAINTVETTNEKDKTIEKDTTIEKIETQKEIDKIVTEETNKNDLVNETEKINKDNRLDEEQNLDENNDLFISSETGVKNVLIEDDLLFEGILGEQIMFFTINEQWEMKDTSYVYLKYAHSLPEKYLGSTLTVYINNIPVNTIFLNNEETLKEELRFSIKSSYFREGVNEFKIRTYHRITDLRCEDNINPGNWVVILKNSYLHLEYDHKNDSTSLEDYPYPYIVEGSEDPVNAILEISNNYRNQDLKGALLLATEMGHRIPFENIEPDIQKFNNKPPQKNIIYIGGSKNIPEIYQNLLNEEEQERIKKEVLVKEVYHPLNKNKKLLMIIGDSEEYQLLGIESLFEGELQNQNDKSTVWIGDQTFILEDTSDEDEYISFKEMGYNPITLTGERFNSVIYDYRLPNNWSIKNGAQLYLRTRYADVIDYDTSSITVKINGTPIFSKKLVKEGRILDEFFVEIPKEFQTSNFLRIELAFSLDVPTDCDNASFDRNTWAFVSNESYLYFPHKEKDIFDLGDYPYPLVSNGRFNNLKVVYESNMDLNILTHIFGYLGHQMNRLDDFELIESKNAELENGNILYVGSSRQGNFIDNINNELRVGYDESLEQFRRDNIDLINIGNESIGVLQLNESDDWNMISLTGLVDKPLKNASKYLSDYGFTNLLDGHVQILYQNGQNQVAYKFIEDDLTRTVSEKNNVNRDALNKLSGEEVRIFLMFLGALIFGTVLILVIRKRS